MVAICCLVDLVSEWGVLPLRVCYHCFGLYWHERSDWSKLPVSDGWCSWFDSTFCLFIFSAGEGLTEILPPGGYFSLDVVEYHMGHMRLSSVASSLRERSRMRYCSDLAAGLLPNKQTNKKRRFCWFGLSIWKEIHLLIDWCLFWNNAADWFTQGLINIYVSFNCFLFGYVSTRTLEHPSQRFNQEENFTAAHRDSIKLFISRRAKLLRTVS